MTYTKEELIYMLKLGNYEVSFTKRDGTTRIMKCTLKSDVISELVGNKQSLSESKVSPDVVPVIDIEKQGWRSFRVDSVISVNKID